MSEKKEDVVVRIGLHIEQDGEIPVPCIAIAPDPENDVLHIVATNYEGTHEGARAVAQTLELAAQAIRNKLGEQVHEADKRPRFNPRPVGGAR
ncbi:hypothetical protein SEA_SPARCETUS_5 [Microbacterium phage Sparcetus]|nr:hypothetical protein SEA_SPARCETUS_5 [Microbacterium phage Sparcetus]